MMSFVLDVYDVGLISWMYFQFGFCICAIAETEKNVRCDKVAIVISMLFTVEQKLSF